MLKSRGTHLIRSTTHDPRALGTAYISLSTTTVPTSIRKLDLRSTTAPWSSFKTHCYTLARIGMVIALLSVVRTIPTFMMFCCASVSLQRRGAGCPQLMGVAGCHASLVRREVSCLCRLIVSARPRNEWPGRERDKTRPGVPCPGSPGMNWGTHIFFPCTPCSLFFFVSVSCFSVFDFFPPFPVERWVTHHPPSCPPPQVRASFVPRAPRVTQCLRLHSRPLCLSPP